MKTLRNLIGFALLATVSACAGSPLEPSTPVASTPPNPPEVKIVSVGILYTVPTYRGDDGVNPPTGLGLPAYRIDGVGQNIGGGCVSEISGTTTIEGVSVSWSVMPPVTPGSQFWYTARIELPNQKLPARVLDYTTTFKAKSGC